MNGEMNSGTIVEHLGIKITEVGDDYLTGTMPADARTFQPYGVVHGGANVVLAETLGSIAGAHVIDFATTKCLGQEVSASHLRPGFKRPGHWHRATDSPGSPLAYLGDSPGRRSRQINLPI